MFDYEAQYWRGQNQSVDVTDVGAKLKAEEGGFPDYVVAADAWQGKWWAIPMAINAWPMHVRQDLMDAKGLKWPTNWDEFRQTARAIQKPPELYGFGYTLGVTGDCNNHFLATLWTFGGALQTEDGKFGVKEPDDKAWLDALRADQGDVRGGQGHSAGLDQLGRRRQQQRLPGRTGLGDVEPDLGLRLAGQEQAGSGQGDQVLPLPEGAGRRVRPGRRLGEHRLQGQQGARTWPRRALENFAKPASHRKYIQDLKGRFLPVYKNLVDDPMWKGNPLFEQYTTIAKNGRIMAHNASPTAPYADITTNYLIGDDDPGRPGEEAEPGAGAADVRHPGQGDLRQVPEPVAGWSRDSAEGVVAGVDGGLDRLLGLAAQAVAGTAVGRQPLAGPDPASAGAGLRQFAGEDEPVAHAPMLPEQ